MTHILIVDDEGLERQAMKQILTQAFPGLKQLGEANSGREAVSYVRDHAPELVLMDIKMPGMDGLKAIQEIKKFNDKTRFIMVSAFDTFEYAQKAIREGVRDYLVKPSKKEEIIQTIAKALQEVEEEDAKQKKDHEIEMNYHRALHHLQTDWVSSLLLNHIHRESFYLDVFSADDYQQFVAIALQIQPIDDNESFPIKEKTKLYEEISGIISSVCLAAMGPLMSFQIPIMLPFIEDQNDTSIQSRATLIARELLKKINRAYPSLNFRIGIGDPVDDVYRFADSYQKALLALEETTENVSYLYYHPSILTKRSETRLDDYEQLLFDMIRSGNINAFDRMFYDYFNELTSFYGHSLEQMIQHLEELRILLNRYLKEWQSDYLLPEFAFHSDTFLQLRERSRSSLYTLIQHTHRYSNQVKGGIFKAKEWIDTHFCEEVTLDEVAASIQLSPYYFSKLFKEHFGQTFIDYLTQKRIELAKKQLISTQKTLKEICFEIGYHDPNYFSRVFKKITGTSPSEFRNNLFV